LANRTIRTPEKGDRLIRQFELGKSVSAACRAERIGRRTYYDWRTEDPDFAARADAAIEAGTDRLEDQLFVRAAKNDTTAAIFLLKARRPDKYRETVRRELTGADGGPIQHEYRDLSVFDDDELASLRSLKRKQLAARGAR
jgi:hypothetical protein